MDWICLNSDGRVRADNSIGCGGVFRDHHDSWLGGYAENIWKYGNLIAELWGVLVGINVAHDRGYTRIMVQMDNKQVF